MRKLIIHPGMGKTATSTIQKQLFFNSGITSNNGVLVYPNVGLDKEKAHHFFSDKYPGFSVDNFNNIIIELKRIAFESNDDSLFVISSEFLVHSSDSHIERLSSIFRDIFDEVEVVFAIRNYRDIVYSSYLQAVKVNYGIVNGESILDYASRMGSGFDFNLLISRWESVGSIKIFDFDNFKSNVIAGFFEYLGVDDFIVAPGLEKENTSIIEDVVSLIFNFDAANRDDLNRDRFIDNMLSFSNDYKDFKSSSMRDSLSYLVSEYEKDFEVICSNYNFIGGRNVKR